MVRQRATAGERPKRESPHGPRGMRVRGAGLPFVAAVVACCIAFPCGAIDQVVLEVGQVSTARVQASHATITLDVTSRLDSTSPTLRAQIAQMRLIAPEPAIPV